MSNIHAADDVVASSSTVKGRFVNKVGFTTCSMNVAAADQVLVRFEEGTGNEHKILIKPCIFIVDGMESHCRRSWFALNQ
jgi:hypothetical protein